MTAAMLASRNGKDGCLQLLIAARVDLEAKDNVSEYASVCVGGGGAPPPGGEAK